MARDIEKDPLTPPVPPIPAEHDQEAWRRRSLMRQSYTELIACGNNTDPLPTQNRQIERNIRPVSQISVTSTIDVRNSRVQLKKSGHDRDGAPRWERDSCNPRNWRKRRKWYQASVAAGVAFAVAFASSTAALSLEALQSKYHGSQVISTLPLSLFLLGMASGPLLGGALATLAGRKMTYLAGVLFCAALAVGSGFGRNLPGITVCHLLSGLCGGAALNQSSATVIDLWRTESRFLAALLVDLMPLLGAVVGAVVSGYVTSYGHFRWTQFVAVCALAACVLPIIFTAETSKAIIRLRRHGVRNRPLYTALIGPIKMLVTRPKALFVSLSSSYGLAVIYASFIAWPRDFSAVYALNLGSQGLVFVSMISGLIIGAGALLLCNALAYNPRAETWQAQRAAEAEKLRRRTQRASHATITSTKTRKSGTSNFSRPQPQVPAMPKWSEPSSPAGSFSPRFMGNVHVIRSDMDASSRSQLSLAMDMEKNTCLAIAASQYLNSVPDNYTKHILPERIMLLLCKNLAFTDLCAALESYELRFDRVKLAKALVDAMPDMTTSQDALGRSYQMALESSRSLHHAAAAAALDEPLTSQSIPRDAVASLKVPLAPASWRLWPALPATVLQSASLFLFGWSMKSHLHCIVPCIGMAGVALSTLMIFVSSNLYLKETYGNTDGESAIAASMILRYLLSFAFVMFARPLYEHLAMGWASSVLAFIGLVLGAIPWVLVLTTARSSKERWR
ncbi:hypothetical protein LTR78_006858 [Recurvomyces mirabilis]|uniref:Major facilitator superfamily (MFS) profile domain-containing protein n=1 Tax=Recurvomyces mirabilis TaxID=574656 RepID=A0AAE1BZE9_9PEZI|nr:hypothetical protein LTR78_006858 [Recurvomyces mirabilis]KAK5153151.1 hypothetical protein LTS14_007796 [Recurvomyces mirabilis]